MSETVEQLDGVAQSMVRAYRRLGEYAIVIRTTPSNNLRIICSQADMPKVSELLRQAADLVFDGTGVKVTLSH